MEGCLGCLGCCNFPRRQAVSLGQAFSRSSLKPFWATRCRPIRDEYRSDVPVPLLRLGICLWHR